MVGATHRVLRGRSPCVRAGRALYPRARPARGAAAPRRPVRSPGRSTCTRRSTISARRWSAYPGRRCASSWSTLGAGSPRAAGTRRVRGIGSWRPPDAANTTSPRRRPRSSPTPSCRRSGTAHRPRRRGWHAVPCASPKVPARRSSSPRRCCSASHCSPVTLPTKKRSNLNWKGKENEGDHRPRRLSALVHTDDPELHHGSLLDCCDPGLREAVSPGDCRVGRWIHGIATRSGTESADVRHDEPRPKEQRDLRPTTNDF